MSNSSLVQVITQRIEEILVEGGQDDRPLSERSLSEQLGVSRPILREALSSLRQRGLVEVIPGKGIFPAKDIHEPTVTAITDYLRREAVGFPSLIEGRLFLETRTAELAAERRTDEDLERLTDAVDRMDAAIHDAPGFEAADLDFHLMLAEATGNRLYLIWLQPIIGMVAERSNRVAALGEVRVRALAAHRAILHAIDRRDTAAARAEMETHLHAFDADVHTAIRLGLLPPDTDDPPQGD